MSAETTAANDVLTLAERLAEMVKGQQEQATLLKELTDQLNAITLAAQTTAARARRSTIVGATGVVLGLVACAIALIR